MDLRELKKFADIISKMPKVKVPNEDDKVICACGEAKNPVTVCKPFHTGVVTALDNVCPGCEKRWSRHTKLVCATCRTVVGRFEPGKDKDGFIFPEGGTLHVKTCGFCDKSHKGQMEFEIPIVEKLLYRKHKQ